MTTLRQRLPSTSSDHMLNNKSSRSRTFYQGEELIRSTNSRPSRRSRSTQQELVNITNSKLMLGINMAFMVNNLVVEQLCNRQDLRYMLKMNLILSRKNWTKVRLSARWEQRLLSFTWKIRMRTRKSLKEGRSSWILIRTSWKKTRKSSLKWSRIWDWTPFSPQGMRSQIFRSRLVFRILLDLNRFIKRLRIELNNLARDRPIRVKVLLDLKFTWETSHFRASKTSSVMAKSNNIKFPQVCSLKAECQVFTWTKSNTNKFWPRVIASIGKLRKMEAVWLPLQRDRLAEESKISSLISTKKLKTFTLRRTTVKALDLVPLLSDPYWCQVEIARKCLMLLKL